MPSPPDHSETHSDVQSAGSQSAGDSWVGDWISEQYPRIHRAAWMMTGDPWAAEDLAQDTFVVALDKWDRFDGRSSRSTWLYGILVRLRQRHGRTLARMRRRLLTYADRNQPREIDDPQTQLAASQWRESVWADVARLPESQRDAIVLRYAEDMPYEEIAAALQCAVGTAKTRVHHGLKRLKAQGSTQDLLSESPIKAVAKAPLKTTNHLV